MEDLITCKICGKRSTRIYGAHLKSHGLTSDDYKKMFPGEPLYTESDNKETSKNSGKHMKQEKYKKMFSDKIKGENNPNSKSKTTEEQRQNRSPFSKKFFKYDNDSQAIDFAKKVQSERMPESYNTKIDFWINKGYSYEDAELQLIKRQKTFTLDKCVEKYGEEKGKLIYKERQIKWQKSLLDNGNLKCGYSLISQELFYKILDKYDIENRDKIYFAKKNQEYFISLKGGEFYQYDFTDKNKNKIIEYNSDMYHANPDKWSNDDNPHPFRKWLTSIDIWKKDERKLKVAIDNGFEVLVIWDSDYKKNPDKVILDCLNFLNN